MVHKHRKIKKPPPINGDKSFAVGLFCQSLEPSSWLHFDICLLADLQKLRKNLKNPKPTKEINKHPADLYF